MKNHYTLAAAATATAPPCTCSCHSSLAPALVRLQRVGCATKQQIFTERGVTHKNGLRVPNEPQTDWKFVNIRRKRSKFLPITASANESQDSNFEYIQKLNSSFREESSSGVEFIPLIEPGDQGLHRERLFLPVFSVQWTLLPGFKDDLHIFMPHCVHMFETILNGCPPYLYAHVHIPKPNEESNGESSNGTNPLLGSIGTLAEIKTFERLSDGRLLIESLALKKIKIVQVLEDIPYAKVIAETQTDKEEETVLNSTLLHSSENGENLKTVLQNLIQSEAEFWDVYDEVRKLSSKLRFDGKIPTPPPPLNDLMPSSRLSSDSLSSPSSSNMESSDQFVFNAHDPSPNSERLEAQDGTDILGEDHDNSYSIFKRIQKLSYFSSLSLPNLTTGEGRLQLLQTQSVSDRLEIVVDLLLKAQKVLVALVAINVAFDDE